MKKGATIKGFDKVMKNLNAEIQAIKGRTMGGLIDASIIVRNDMDKTPPLIPVDTGNLRESWFTTPLKQFRKIGLIMGFSANYAAFIHEMVDAVFSRSGAGAKFFESSVKRNKDEILQTIRDSIKIK